MKKCILLIFAMIIKKPRSWKKKLLLALAVAFTMEMAFFAVTASAQTLYESVNFADVNTSLDPYNTYGSFGGPFTGNGIYPSHPLFAEIATGTITNVVTVWRWIPWAPDNFDGSQTISLQLWRSLAGNTTYYDCWSDPFIPDQMASSGVKVLTNFAMSGTECDQFYPGPHDDPDIGYNVPPAEEWQTGIQNWPGVSGAVQHARLPDGNRPMLIYGAQGPTNPDLLIPLENQSTPITFNTRFTNAVAVGASSSTVAINVDYELDTAEYTANTRPDYITIQIINDGFFSDTQVASANELILPLQDGPANVGIPINYNFPDGEYFAYIHFWNINTDSITFEETGVVISFEVAGGVVINALIEQITDGLTIDPDIYEDCSISNLDGCFKNALIFVFVPAPDAFDKFLGLYESIELKPPFGYVNAFKNALGGVGAGITSAFDFGSIPFINNIFDPFKGIIVIGLWVLYAIHFTGRVNNLDI